MKRVTGTYHITRPGGEEVKAFIPHPLPPVPELLISPALQYKLNDAFLALGRLDSISELLPGKDVLLYMYVRKEAVLSSRIEGTQSSLSDLLLYEIDGQPGVPLDDAAEVSRYSAALQHGVKRLGEGFPLCCRLLREMHTVLLGEGRGADKQPGEFRRSQNWLGGSRPGNARFVPPPPERVPGCMGELEAYLNSREDTCPQLIKAALAHVQFETIHPFLDGNGRLGRLLITLLLIDGQVMHSPLLYLSLFFKTHQQEYYALLNRVRTDGDWESWIDFFVEALISVAGQATATVTDLTGVTRRDQDKLAAAEGLAASVHSVYRVVMEHPLVTVKKACTDTGLVPHTVLNAFRTLEELGIVREITGRRRGRVYSYTGFIDIINRE